MAAASDGELAGTEHWQMAPVVALSAVLLLLGLAPATLIAMADRAADGVLDVQPYINVVLDSVAPVTMESKP